MGPFAIPLAMAATGASIAASPTLAALSGNKKHPTAPAKYYDDEAAQEAMANYVNGTSNQGVPASTFYEPVNFPSLYSTAQKSVIPDPLTHLSSLGTATESAQANAVESAQATSTPPTTTAKATPASTVPTQTPTAQAPNSARINELVQGVMKGKYGNGADRKKALGADYDAVQAVINKMPAGTFTSSGSKKTEAKTENKPKVGGNWMDSLSALLPLLALGAGAYYLGK